VPYRDLPLDLIDADHQDNDRFALDPDALRELADSIRAVGLINPIAVAQHGDRFHLIAGYRRLEACRLIGLDPVPAVIRDTPPERHVSVRLAENLTRANLSPVEEARTLQRLIQQHHHPPEQLATTLNRSTNWIQHRLALANYPEPVLEALHRKAISLAVADELALVLDPAQCGALLAAAIDSGCTGRQAAAWRVHANAYTGESTTAPTQSTPPQVLGPPPVVTKACAACQRPTPLTRMSYVCLCGDCTAAILHATAKPLDAAPPAG